MSTFNNNAPPFVNLTNFIVLTAIITTMGFIFSSLTTLRYASTGNAVTVGCCSDNSCGENDVDSFVWKFTALFGVIMLGLWCGFIYSIFF